MWKCSKCEAMVEDTEKLCPQCGEACPEIEVEESDAPEVVENEEVTAENEEIEAENEETATEDEEISDEVDADEEIEVDEEIVEPSSWICATCGAECDGDECPECGQLRPEEEPAPKKSSKIYGFVIAVSVVVVITIGIFFYFFMNRYVDKTSETGTVTAQDIQNAMDGITGDEVAMRINGIDVPKDVFEALYLSNALMYQQDFCSGNVAMLDNFKWTDIADDKTKETHQQKVLADTVNTLNNIYSILSLGDEFGVEPSQIALEAVATQIESHKKEFGKDFEKLLKLSGYRNIDHYKQILIMDARYKAVLDDMEENPDRYIGTDLSVYNYENPDKVYVKSIVISSETSKEDAKKTADEILKEAKKNDNFDELIDKYSESEQAEKEPNMIQKGMLSSQLPEMKDFEDTALKLKINEVSKLIESPLGYFILKRVATTNDAIELAVHDSKIVLNKSLLEETKITTDYKKLYEEQTSPEVEEAPVEEEVSEEEMTEAE